MTDLTTLSADVHNNTLGAYLRQLWDARTNGQTHGIWRPRLGRFVTMEELVEMQAKQSRVIHVDIIPFFKPGDPAPSGYNEWHEWAEVQCKAGLRQSQCSTCNRWYFPHEKHNCEEQP